MNMEIKSITMNSGCVDILIDTKSNKKRVFVAKLNDFDEVGTGQLVETKKKKVGYTYLFRFELTERFDAFHDGLLKLVIADPRFHLPQQTLYFIIYSLDMLIKRKWNLILMMLKKEKRGMSLSLKINLR